MKILLTVLTIAAAVLGGIIALIIIIFLMILPVKAELITGYNADEKFFLRAKYSSFVMDLIPLSRKPRKKGSGENAEDNNSDKKTDRNKKGIFERKLHMMQRSDYINLLGYVTDSLKKMRFGEIFANIIVSTEDAAETAILYGTLTGAVFPVLGRIDSSGKAKNINVHINADFAAGTTFADINVEVYLRTVHAVALALKVLIYILKLKEKENGK